MTRDLVLPGLLPDDPAFAHAVRELRDHLLGAVEVDLEIRLDGRLYRIAWADRRPVHATPPEFWMTAGMRVIDGRGVKPPDIVPTGEEQITLVVDDERLVFHLVASGDEPDDEAPPEPQRLR